MTVKELKILDKEIQYLCNYQDRIKEIRQVTNINPSYSFTKEAEIIEYLYKSILEERKKDKSTFFSIGTSGWYVIYLREKKTYKKGENFKIKIFHSFAYTDNLG